ncbi:MAG: IS66 family insertion sequence element accessory protein TnpB [Candidatus Schekmanbacteria bacterium]|nr:IS66 family insertion sequence element accessory protein TnpB [Candidatus Schekmanbacteria bacterium]
MIQLTLQMRILVALEPVDFRGGIDALAQVCRAALHADPFSGTVFVFRNRRRNAVKILVYDGWGFWLCARRLSMGRLRWWPKANGSTAVPLLAHELGVLLCGGDPSVIQTAPRWRRVDPAA